MRYKVEIVNCQTLERRIRDMGEVKWEDGSEYWWTDGNMGCDCNRHLEFNRALGKEPDEDIACGSKNYLVTKVIIEDGSVVLIDPEM